MNKENDEEDKKEEEKTEEEKKDLIEKRSSFRGWKERNKGKMYQKTNIIAIVIIVSIFLALIAYPYLNKIDDNNKQHKKSTDRDTKKSLNSDNKSSPKEDATKSPRATDNTNISKKDTTKSPRTTNSTNISKENVIGNIGTPLVNNGFEITIKTVTPTVLHTSVWISIKNKDNKEKLFKLGPDTAIIDNKGQQYGMIHVTKSAEIDQTNLSAKAMREGAVFFNKFKDESRDPKKLILDISGHKVEFMLKVADKK